MYWEVELRLHRLEKMDGLITEGDDKIVDALLHGLLESTREELRELRQAQKEST